jgi:hypothetical protein
MFDGATSRFIGIGRGMPPHQLIAASMRVKITLPSIFESYAMGLVCLIERTYFSAGNRQEQICEIAGASALEFPIGSWHVMAAWMLKRRIAGSHCGLLALAPLC